MVLQAVDVEGEEAVVVEGIGNQPLDQVVVAYHVYVKLEGVASPFSSCEIYFNFGII